MYSLLGDICYLVNLVVYVCMYVRMYVHMSACGHAHTVDGMHGCIHGCIHKNDCYDFEACMIGNTSIPVTV